MPTEPSLLHNTGRLAIVVVVLLTWVSSLSPSKVAHETTETDTSDLSLRDVLADNRYMRGNLQRAYRRGEAGNGSAPEVAIKVGDATRTATGRQIMR